MKICVHKLVLQLHKNAAERNTPPSTPTPYWRLPEPERTSKLQWTARSHTLYMIMLMLHTRWFLLHYVEC